MLLKHNVYVRLVELNRLLNLEHVLYLGYGYQAGDPHRGTFASTAILQTKPGRS